MITIRIATSDDLPELTRLWHEKSIIEGQFDRRFTLLPDGKSRWSRAVEEWMNDADYIVFIAGDGERALGYIIGHAESAPPGLSPESVGVVTDMAVDPHGHQGGLGKSLLAALKQWFAQQGLSIMIAHVPHRGTVEQAFWRAQGATGWMDLMWIQW